MTEDRKQLRERIAEAIAKEVVVSGQTVTDLSGYLPMADAVLDAIAPLVDENTALRDRVDALRDQVGRVTRERDEWEANEQEQAQEVERLHALTEGDPTSIYHEAAELRAERDALRARLEAVEGGIEPADGAVMWQAVDGDWHLGWLRGREPEEGDVVLYRLSDAARAALSNQESGT